MTLPLQKQVCSLELSQKLKKLGVPQESLWTWQKTTRGYVLCQYTYEKTPSNEGDNRYSAYTVAELGEMLPLVVTTKSGEDHYLNCFRASKWTNGEDELLSWSIGYENGVFTNEEVQIQEAKTEADARAKMLIYLLENKLITL